MAGLLRRIGLPLLLRLADAIAGILPSGVAYALADLGGRAWHRWSPARRGVVEANLARVCAATRRPTSGPAFRRLVRAAFVEHARYWLEVLRVHHYPESRIDAMLEAEGWEALAPIFRAGCVIAVPHLGNFEPFGHFIESHGIAGVAPVEETEPKELYRFLLERRIAGGRGVRLIPLSEAMRPMLAALRAGQVVALAADRDLAGDGMQVDLFGHPTTVPLGPATLALRTGRPLLVARALRVGRDRFSATAWPVEAERSGDRQADAAALTRAMVRRFESVIGETPEQWFGAFQPIWLDQRGEA